MGVAGAMAVLLSAIPAAILVFVFQRHIVRSQMGSGAKRRRPAREVPAPPEVKAAAGSRTSEDVYRIRTD